MQELEKILEEIDETIERYGSNPELITEDITDFCYGLNVAKDIICKHLNDEKCGNCSRRKWYQKGYEDARKNGGWIPVDDRLPTMEEYQKDDGRFILDDGSRRYAGYFDVCTGKFYRYQHVTAYRAELHEDNRVIAWNSLPDLYRPERSDNHDGE